MVWIKYRHSITGNWVYTRIMGDIYGGQTAEVSWKNHRTHVLVVKGGFIECKNMESIYYHPGRGIKMAIHVDDPLASSPSMTQTTMSWVHDFMDLEFDTNGRNILTIGKQIDYLSMEITLLYTFDITLTNTAKIDFFLEEAGKSDVMTPTMRPMTKASLKLV